MDKPKFLREESEDAKAAMRATLRNAAKDIFHAVDPRIWAKAHPWKTVSIAAAAGFAAGTQIGKPSEEQKPEQAKPGKPSKAARLLMRILKRAIRTATVAAQPFLAELLAAEARAGNGVHPASNPAGRQNPADSAGPNRP
jgi:hypothetical protein